ncbi:MULTISPECIES: hypothetical protein [Streptomyces]|uniref:hypothetical protein n=1 Tax=Streptomyces TaxID=1883 RepID=UPI0022498DF7|nr:hypothetical protein [Streptomyces sp. JHD 1]MCX2969632.1 hypothetical protein [Streptomyces sp. JHD 1]
MNDTLLPMADRRSPERSAAPQNRTRDMQLMPETLSRARMQDYLREVDSERVARRLVAARRMQRKAERASLRARRALARTVMH